MLVESYTDTREALGSKVDFTFVTKLSKSEVESVFAKLWLKVYIFEQKFSRFISSSELSTFNRRAGESVYVSPEFRDMLIAARAMSLKTDGLFNPFILPTLQRAGYRKSFVKKYENDYQDDYSACRVANPSELIIGYDHARIPEHTAIDLGGCGKGYLADQLSQCSELVLLQGYWLSLGGDIVGAGTDKNGDPWSISVEDATDPDNTLKYVFPMTARKFSIATSGVIHRKGVDGKRRWHHLIDPATGSAASTDVFLASVSAETTLEADVLASCAVIKGSAHALDYVKSHGARSALIQFRGEGRTVQYDHFGKVSHCREAVGI